MKIKDIQPIVKDFISDYKNNRLGKPEVYLFKIDETLLFRREPLSNKDLEDIDIVDPCSRQAIIKSKIVPKDNIIGFFRVPFGSITPQSFVNFLKERFLDLGIEEERIYCNDLGEIYVDSLKLNGIDFKKIEVSGEAASYGIFFLFINRDPSLDKRIQSMRVKSTYGYISEIKGLDHFDFDDFFLEMKKYFLKIVEKSTSVKEVPYSKTVDYIKKCFENLGVTFKEEIEHPFENVWYCNISNEKYHISQQGKGITKEACLASGYAECMERFTNLSFCLDCTEYFKEETSHNFYFYPDERIIDGKICLPFYEVQSKEIKYLDIENIRSFCKSNGMTVGNSSAEALVAGLSEILERFTERFIYDNKLTPPTISKEYLKENYPIQYSTIGEIEQKSGLEVIVKDASLGKGIPALFIILLDKKNFKYRKVFGAHPLFKEALNRCLTECCQRPQFLGNEIRTSKFSDVEESSYYDSPYYTFMRTCSHLGGISIPWFVFYDKPSWGFKQWGNYSRINNKKEVLNLLNIISNFSSEIYIRSFNFLGFPSFSIYVPGISEITSIPSDNLDNSITSWIKNNEELSPELLNQMINRFETYNDLTCLINLPREILLVVLYLKAELYGKAISLLRTFPSYDILYRALSIEISMLRDNVPEDCRDEVLRYYFDESIINEIKENWRGSNLGGILKKETFPQNNELKIEDIKEVKDAMVKRVENQSSIGLLLDKWKNL